MEVSGQLHASAALPPGKEPQVPDGQQDGCAPESFWKVKLLLCLIKQLAMKTYWGADVEFHAFLTWGLDGRKWSASCPGRRTPGEKHGTHWIEGSVGSRTGPAAVMK